LLQLVGWFIWINREVHYEEDQKVDGGTVYKQILLNAQLQIGKRGEKQSWLGKSLI
jgi:hypothetical protein